MNNDSYFEARLMNHILGFLDLLKDYDEEMYGWIVALLTDETQDNEV